MQITLGDTPSNKKLGSNSSQPHASVRKGWDGCLRQSQCLSSLTKKVLPDFLRKLLDTSSYPSLPEVLLVLHL